MSKAYDKGRAYEMELAKFIRRKLGIKAARDNRSGAGNFKGDIRIEDYLEDNTVHIEAKHHEKTDPRAWYRQAHAGASFGQKPVVAFSDEEHQHLGIISMNDLLDLLIEIHDLRQEVADLREPVVPTTPKVLPGQTDLEEEVQKVEQPKRDFKTCRNGHIIGANQVKCLMPGCKYSVYGASKSKKKDK